MIVVRPRGFDPEKEEPYVGLIYKRGKINGSDMVLVMWSDQDRTPPYYKDTFGYLVTNIHNLPHEFQLFRDGEVVREAR